MAKTAVSRERIAQLEDNLSDVVAQLRKMRQEWADSGVDEIELELEKAEGFVDYLKTIWMHRCYAQFRTGLTSISVSKKRQELSERKKSRKGE